MIPEIENIWHLLDERESAIKVVHFKSTLPSITSAQYDRQLCTLEKPKTATRVLFLGFTKTFDRIHPKLLEDKERIGVREALIPWIASYLRKRKHSSKIKNIRSEQKKVNKWGQSSTE